MGNFGMRSVEAMVPGLVLAMWKDKRAIEEASALSAWMDFSYHNCPAPGGTRKRARRSQVRRVAPNSGWCGLENVSAGCANDLGQPHSPVLGVKENTWPSTESAPTTIRTSVGPLLQAISLALAGTQQMHQSFKSISRH